MPARTLGNFSNKRLREEATLAESSPPRVSHLDRVGDCSSGQGQRQQVVLRVGMPPMLAEPLRGDAARQVSPRLAPAPGVLQVIIHPVMASKPLSLGRMARQHSELDLQRGADVDQESGWDQVPEAVFSFDRIGILTSAL